MPHDAAHRFVADLDAAAYKHQLSDELAVYLLVQVAREVAVDRGLDWSALVNHMQGFAKWRGHTNCLPVRPNLLRNPALPRAFTTHAG